MSTSRRVGAAQGDRGSALILVLVLVLVVGMISIPMLSYATTVLRANRVTSDRTVNADHAKSGLRIALGDPATVYTDCGADPGGGVELAMPPLGVTPTTRCYLLEETSAGGDEYLRFGSALVAAGETLPPSLFGSAYSGSGNTDTAAWISDSSSASGPDVVWLPNLPSHVTVQRSSTPYWLEPGPASDCRVYFPGTYQDPVVLDARTYFASGVYYFENTINVTGGADVVGGIGTAEGCALDLDLPFYTFDPPSSFDISGAGVTFILGERARLTFDDSSGPISFRLNNRYVADDDDANLPSRGVSIMTVNGDDDGSALHVPDVLDVPASRVGVDGSSLAVNQGLVRSIYTPEPRAPGAPPNVGVVPWSTASCATDSTSCLFGAIGVSWDASESNGAAVTQYVATAYLTSSGVAAGSCAPLQPSAPRSSIQPTCTIDGLGQGLDYMVRVVATNSVGDSDPGSAAGSVRPDAFGAGISPTLDVLAPPLDLVPGVMYGTGAEVIVTPDASVPGNPALGHVANATLANSLVNGDFATDLSGWTAVGDVDWLAGYVRFNSTDLVAPADGSLTQDVATIPGVDYSLSYDLAVDGTATIFSEITADVRDGASVLGTETTEMTTGESSTETIVFTATSTLTTIEFLDVTTDVAGLDPTLDNITLTSLAVPITCDMWWDETSCVLNGLQPHTVWPTGYEISVVTVNSVGDSIPFVAAGPLVFVPGAAEAPATVVPEAPGNPLVAAWRTGSCSGGPPGCTPSAIVTSWDSAVPGDGPTTGYTARAYRASDGVAAGSCSPATPVAPITSVQLTCTIVGLGQATDYFVNVTALNAAGESLPSVDSAVVTPNSGSPLLTVPDPPNSVTFGQMYSDGAEVVVGAPALDVGGPLTGYVVTARPVDPVVNGTFDSDLSGWTTSGRVRWRSAAGGRMQFYRDSNGHPDGIASQTVPTVVGKSYTLTFDARRNGSSGSVNVVAEVLDGATVLGDVSVVKSNGGSTSHSISFIATGPSTTIRFTEPATFTAVGPDINVDNVALNSNSAPISCSVWWDDTSCVLGGLADSSAWPSGYDVSAVARNFSGSSAPTFAAAPLVFVPGLNPAPAGPPAEAIVPAYRPVGIIDMSLTSSNQVDIVIPGYVSVPQGRVVLETANPDSLTLEIDGGLLAAMYDTNLAVGGDISMGMVNGIVQRRFLIVSEAENVVSSAVVQVNLGGVGYSINSWNVG